MKPSWIRAAGFAGITPDHQQIEMMSRYGAWLASEGLQAGGVGPAEAERIDRRHLADSLLFAAQLPAEMDTAWDLGSGVGLPGIPLAICLPATDFVLVDRSGRRCDLLRRAIRVLGLHNCHVVQTDFTKMSGQTGAIVSRASLPPDELRDVMRRHLRSPGVGVVAGSWRQRPRFEGWNAIEIPEDVLDQSIWLLIMRRQ